MENTYTKIALVVFITSLLAGCNLDVNNDPNRITESTVTGALIFPAAAHETGERVASNDFTFLDNWMGYWASSSQFSIDYTETTYSITPAFADVLWQNHYNVLFDLEQARSKSIASGDTLTAGASIILSALLWQDLVDMYGNIPYSQALQYLKYPQPTYDKGQDIYNDLQTKLDLAISYMGAQGLSSFASSTDIVNHGDKTKWTKLANTLKLRLLIRQSEIPGFDPSADLAKITANGGVLQSGETVSVNPGYTNAVNKQSPFYANFGLTVNDVEAAPSVRANDYFVTILNSNSDPRSTQYFLTVSGVVVGNIYGIGAQNPTTSSGIGPGLANDASQDQWIFTSVESLFLEAEAIDRGWLPGTASSKYNEAVTESFIWLGVPDAATAAAAYLASFPYVAGDDYHNTLFQKYIAMCGIAPVEAWNDFRRMAIPTIPATSGPYQYLSSNKGVVSKTLPVRLLYAQSEYTTNGTNVSAEGTINQFTSKIFWDVN